MPKAQILIQCSDEFKRALDDFADERKTTLTNIVKRSIASYIGYDDVESELKRGPRTPKYSSEADKAHAETLRRELRAWASKAITRYLKAGNIEIATLIATALDVKDYDTLQMSREELESEPDDNDEN